MMCYGQYKSYLNHTIHVNVNGGHNMLNLCCLSFPRGTLGWYLIMTLSGHAHSFGKTAGKANAMLIEP